MYIISHCMKKHTALPSVKGQVTIPAEIRDKYHIDKSTPLVIEDKGKGVITLKVMKMVDPDAIEFYEDKKNMSIHFKNGVDCDTLIDLIDEIDG